MLVIAVNKLQLSFKEVVLVQTSSLKFVRGFVFCFCGHQLFSFKRALAPLEWVVFAPNQSLNSGNRFNLALN